MGWRPGLVCLDVLSREYATVVSVGSGLSGGGVHSHSTDECISLKQYEQQAVLPWPANAIFHRVGSKRTQAVSGSAAAFWRDLRLYLVLKRIVFSPFQWLFI